MVACASRQLKAIRLNRGLGRMLTLIRVWVEKYERDEFDDEIEAANLLGQYEARIAALDRMVGRLALENDLLKKVSQASRPPKDAGPSVITGPWTFPSPKDVA